MCNKNEDHCGPMVVNWRTWLMSWFIPDDLWGIYIGDLCKIHDDGYERGGTEDDRLNRDSEFRHGIKKRLLNNLISKRKARNASDIYYIGVSLGGKEYFNYHQ